jgi:hypothetical protein
MTGPVLAIAVVIAIVTLGPALAEWAARRERRPVTVRRLEVMPGAVVITDDDCTESDAVIAELGRRGVPVTEVRADDRPDLLREWQIRRTPALVLVGDHARVAAAMQAPIHTEDLDAGLAAWRNSLVDAPSGERRATWRDAA